VQEQQGGAPSADLLIGLGIDERFARGGATFLSDALGTTTALASGGTVQTNYGYDPYGVAQTTGTASDNSFQYTGRENDGTALLHYRSRYYSPTWGRFVSEDPIGLRGGDVNLYRYVANNPVQGRDPSGEFVPIAIAAAAALGLGAEVLLDSVVTALTLTAAVGAATAAGKALTQCINSGGCIPPSPVSPTQPVPTPANAKASPRPTTPRIRAPPVPRRVRMLQVTREGRTTRPRKSKDSVIMVGSECNRRDLQTATLQILVVGKRYFKIMERPYTLGPQQRWC